MGSLVWWVGLVVGELPHPQRMESALGAGDDTAPLLFCWILGLFPFPAPNCPGVGSENLSVFIDRVLSRGQPCHSLPGRV